MGSIFAAEEVVSKGLLADFMFEKTPYRKAALQELDAGNFSNWKHYASDAYIREAGWYFKTLAVQEIGTYLLTYVPS